MAYKKFSKNIFHNSIGFVLFSYFHKFTIEQNLLLKLF